MDVALARVAGPRSPLARMLRPIVNRVVPDRPATVRVLAGPARGIRLAVELRREKFYWTGAHELDVQRALAGLLRPGMTFWDVGAHVGFFSLLAARLVGPSGRVHAFEPLAENRARLELGARANGFANVVVHACAIGESSGPAYVQLHASSLMGSLAAGGEPVSCRSLDDLASELGAPDVVKLDVEGAEAAAIRGGSRLLWMRKPRLVVEVGPGFDAAGARSLLPHYGVSELSRHVVLS